MHKAAFWTLQSREMSPEMRQKPKVLIAFCISYLSFSRLIEFRKWHSCQAGSRVRISLLEIKPSTLCHIIGSPLNMRANYYCQIYSLRLCHHGARTAPNPIHRTQFTHCLTVCYLLQRTHNSMANGILYSIVRNVHSRDGVRWIGHTLKLCFNIACKCFWCSGFIGLPSGTYLYLCQREHRSHVHKIMIRLAVRHHVSFNCIHSLSKPYTQRFELLAKEILYCY